MRCLTARRLLQLPADFPDADGRFPRLDLNDRLEPRPGRRPRRRAPSDLGESGRPSRCGIAGELVGPAAWREPAPAARLRHSRAPQCHGDPIGARGSHASTPRRTWRPTQRQLFVQSWCLALHAARRRASALSALGRPCSTRRRSARANRRHHPADDFLMSAPHQEAGVSCRHTACSAMERSMLRLVATGCRCYDATAGWARRRDLRQRRRFLTHPGQSAARACA